ncbi:MAG: hypothetical protein LBM98_02335 [Oscillospiraceae bacterium]|nr:hypothetical protein [Oscillospiraceae bacterium]
MRWRLRNDGQGEALPCPGALRRDGGRGLRPAGEPPRRYAPPLPRGEFTGEASATPHPTCASPFPSWEGCRPQAAGWFPRAVRGVSPSKPTSLIFDI